MSRVSKAVTASLAAAGLLVGLPFVAAPSPKPIAAHPGGSPGSGYRPAHPGGSHGGHYGGHGHHYGYRGYYGGYYPGWGWGWGWGIGFGAPWALGWYGPGWGYPAYAYGPAYGPAYQGYAYSCGIDEDCMRAQFSREQGQAPSAQIPPPAPGPEGGPTQRPLHLNYCDSARAWFPQVQSCPGGWRLVLPEYSR